MKNIFIVYKARLTYDKFHVTAETPKEAALRVGMGKVEELQMDVPSVHDAMFDEAGTIVVVSDQLDKCGYQRKLFIMHEEDIYNKLDDDLNKMSEELK